MLDTLYSQVAPPFFYFINLMLAVVVLSFHRVGFGCSLFRPFVVKVLINNTLILDLPTLIYDLPTLKYDFSTLKYDSTTLMNDFSTLENDFSTLIYDSIGMENDSGSLEND